MTTTTRTNRKKVALAGLAVSGMVYILFALLFGITAAVSGESFDFWLQLTFLVPLLVVLFVWVIGGFAFAITWVVNRIMGGGLL